MVILEEFARCKHIFNNFRHIFCNNDACIAFLIKIGVLRATKICSSFQSECNMILSNVIYAKKYLNVRITTLENKDFK